jgi:hypothetical protein
MQLAVSAPVPCCPISRMLPAAHILIVNVPPQPISPPDVPPSRY